MVGAFLMFFSLTIFLLNFLSFSLRKYSPLASSLSTLDSGMGGGKGV